MHRILPVKILTVAMLFTLLSFSAGAAKYYVVIGAFSNETNAKKYVGYARNLFLDAFYKFNPDRNLYYVHVMASSQKEEARSLAIYIQNETKFRDAWVFTDLSTEEIPVPSHHENVAESKTPSGYAPNHKYQDIGPVASTGAYRDYAVDKNLATSKAAVAAASWTTAGEISYTSHKNLLALSGNNIGSANKVFTFIAETPDGKSMPTEVMLVNYEKAKKLSSFKTGEFVSFRGKKRNQKVTLVCDVFGYSEVIRTINLDNMNMTRDIKPNKDGVFEVRFKLHRMKKHDISIMYNTHFYPDAAVLLPSSKKQVDELLTLMKTYPDYKILLHSHCNASPKRTVKIIGTMNGYFDIDGAIEKTATDKQLTKYRAEAIRDYLIENGVDGNRIEVLAWGSMDLLVKPNSADVAINERIEMEIIEL